MSRYGFESTTLLTEICFSAEQKWVGGLVFFKMNIKTYSKFEFDIGLNITADMHCSSANTFKRYSSDFVAPSKPYVVVFNQLVVMPYYIVQFEEGLTVSKTGYPLSLVLTRYLDSLLRKATMS